jgi:hypothetical protein
MSRLNLTPWQRRRLQRQLAQTRDARLYRKTLAVLEFDHGRSAADIARMLGVTRQTVYDWMKTKHIFWRPSSPARRRITATRTRPGPCPCSKRPSRSPRTCASLRRPFAGNCTGWTTCGSGHATT